MKKLIVPAALAALGALAGLKKRKTSTSRAQQIKDRLLRR